MHVSASFLRWFTHLTSGSGIDLSVTPDRRLPITGLVATGAFFSPEATGPPD